MSEESINRGIEQTSREPAAIEADGAKAMSANKIRALKALREGKSLSAASRLAGVTRQTLYAWRQTDPEFARVMAKWKADALAPGSNRLIEVINESLHAIQRTIRAGDARLAMEFLQYKSQLENPKKVHRRALSSVATGIEPSRHKVD